MLDVWRPSASIEYLRLRADAITKIRKFFHERGLLEVETPLLSHATVTDPYIISIPAIYQERGAAKEKMYYLQTSPEYAMKRLLAAGSGPIFQICKAFRQGDSGSQHNPEFTMLEWYRLGYDHHALMDEMDLFLQTILNTQAAERITYGHLFEKYVGINPHTINCEELKTIAKKHIEFSGELTDTNAWLDLLFTHCIEPHIGLEKPLFLYDFPVSQAALAKIQYDKNPPVAARFEVYFKGMELANGFYELQDAKEQRKRFEKDLQYRTQHHLPIVPIDENFIAALEHGLPDCSGVAVGVDRLMMLLMNTNNIDNIISFSFQRI